MVDESRVLYFRAGNEILFSASLSDKARPGDRAIGDEKFKRSVLALASRDQARRGRFAYNA
jgi:hypothetical protein